MIYFSQAQRAEDASLYTDRRLNYLVTRLSSVTIITLVVSALVLVIGLVSLMPTLPGTYRISDTFFEWTRAESDEGCPNQDNLDNLACVGDVFREFAISAIRLVTNFLGLFASMVIEDSQATSLGGVARFLSVFSISSAVFLSYRRHLDTRYELNNQISQLADFRDLKTKTRTFLWTRILYTLATMFGSYVVVSLVWVGLSQIFKEIAFQTSTAWIIIALFVVLSTFAATYWASAVTSREIIMIGAGTFVLGFTVSFAVAPLMNVATVPGGEQWWKGAISNAGKLQPSGALFTSALAGLAIVFWIVWYDIDSIIENAIAHSGQRMTPLINIRHIQWFSVRTKHIIVFFYTLVIIGLISIGLVRVAYPVSQFFLNLFFHSILGAIGAIGGLFFVCWHVSRLTKKTILSPWYDRYFIVGALVSIVALAASYTDIMNLTTAELIIFSLSGVLMVFTIELLLLQADLPDTVAVPDEHI